MRIAIDGVQGTGKTTLLRDLAAEYVGLWPCLPETVRYVSQRFGVTRTEEWPRLLADHRRLKEFFDAEFDYQLRLERAAGSFIIEGSTYLIESYARHFLPAYDRPKYTANYDLILYLPVSIPFDNDGFRFSEGRHEIDSIYNEITDDNLRIVLPTGADRFRRARELIASLAGS